MRKGEIKKMAAFLSIALLVSVMPGANLKKADAYEGTVRINKTAPFRIPDADMTGMLNNPLIKLESMPRLEAVQYMTSVKEAGMFLRGQLENHEESISINIKTTNRDAGKVFNKIWNTAVAETGEPTEGDYLLWHLKSTTADYRGRTFNENGQVVYYYNFMVIFEYLTTLDEEAKLSERLNDITTQFCFDEYTSDYQKVKTIYDYICNNVTYSYSNNDIKFTAYSAMFNGEAVCQGYATLFYRLVKMQGISVRVIPGFGTNSDIYHGWNIVKLGKMYYNSDSTWDATLTQAGRSYKYFLKGDDFKEHTRHKDYDTAEFYVEYPMADTDYATGEQEASDKTKQSIFLTTKPVIKTLSRKKIKIKKVVNASGYEITYSTSKKFKKNATKVVRTKKTTYKLKKLKKKAYYFKTRAYMNISGTRKYSKWSDVIRIRKK